MFFQVTMVYFFGNPSPSLEPRSKSDGEDIPATNPTRGSQGTSDRPQRPWSHPATAPSTARSGRRSHGAPPCHRCRRCPAIRRFLCFGWRKLTPNKIYGTSGTRPVWKKNITWTGFILVLMNQIFAENHNHRFSIVFSYMKYMAHMVVFRPTVQPDDGPKRVSLQ